MSARELKNDLYHRISLIEDVKVLETLLQFIQTSQLQEDWAMSDDAITQMSMQLSLVSLAEVWDNEADEHWNHY